MEKKTFHSLLKKSVFIFFCWTVWITSFWICKLNEYQEPLKKEINLFLDWSNATKDVYIFSAFWDTRSIRKTPFVRIIGVGALRTIFEQKCNCVLKSVLGFTETVPVEKTILGENYNREHTAVFYLCSPTTEYSPDFVRLQCNSSRTVWKKVLKTERSGSTEMALCVRPFFGKYDDTFRLAEFIAYYDLVGVSQFTFYDYDTSNSTKKFISNLKANNVKIDLLPWSLPNNVHIWEYGQLAFIQDCIYRHMKDFGFLIIVDLDEYIVLKPNVSLLHFVKNTDPNAAGLVFRNTYFCRAPGLKSNQLLTETCLIREKMVWKTNYRSKAIVRPYGMISSSIHLPTDLVKNFTVVTIEPEQALLQHYRKGTCANAHVSQEDKTALKYTNGIKKSRVLQIWNYTFQNVV